MWWCLPLAVQCLAFPQPLVRHMQAQPGTVVLVDGNNVRGTDLFAVSQQDLCRAVATWAASNRLTAVLHLDHGSEQRAWQLGEHTALTLSGSRQTADDVIVRDSLWLRGEKARPVFIVSNDVGLIARAKQYRSSPLAGLQVCPSGVYAQMLFGEGTRDRRAESRKESTAQREEAAVALEEQLAAGTAELLTWELPPAGDALAELGEAGGEAGAQQAGAQQAAGDAGGQQAAEEIAEAASEADVELVRAYVAWVNSDAPRGRRHADPVGLAPSPSLKRSLRRKRHKQKAL